MEELFITFGQEHTHRVNNTTFDKDSVARIKCKDYSDGRKIAFELFDNKFATSYTRSQIANKLHYFPRGIIDAN